MAENRCFLISCSAVKYEAEYIESSLPKETQDAVIHEMNLELRKGSIQKQHLAHLAGLAVAKSKDDAESLAKERALAIWPEAEGWTAYSVQAKEIHSDQLEAVVDVLRAGDGQMLLM